MVRAEATCNDKRPGEWLLCPGVVVGGPAPRCPVRLRRGHGSEPALTATPKIAEFCPSFKWDATNGDHPMVHVRAYLRLRFGRVEHVREHWRSLPHT